jgi:DNA repair protein RadA/Sms
MSISDPARPDKSPSRANLADVQPKSHNGHGADAPPWPPALIDAIRSKGRCYVVADPEDADRMNRYGLLTLAVPIVDWLTWDVLKPVHYLEVLQRAGDQDTVFGLAVKRHLIEIGWDRDFNRATLVDVQADTAAVERDCGGDPALFGATILGAFDPLLLERLKPPRRERQAKQARPQGPRPVVITMANVQREAIEWLWWPYVAIGKLCIVDGDPGIGKSLLMTQLAASLSRGYPLPDQQGELTLDPGGAQTTLLLSTEDGLADTIKPRLEDAGADCAKVHVLTGWLGPEDEVHAFTLQHMAVLEAALKRYQPRLVVIDPIQAYLGGVDMHRANEVRPLLAGLTRLAEQYRCAIVLIRHPSKPGQGEGKAIHRGMGSVDFIGAARTGLFVEQHPTEPEKALLAQIKSNIGRLGRTQVFSKAEGLFRWCGVSRLTAELIAGSPRGPDRHIFFEVFCWLETHLRAGVPRASKTIEEALGNEGYRHDTIARAKKALHIRSFPQEGVWYWTLPSLPILPPSTTTDTTDTTVTTDTTDTSDPSVKSMTYEEGRQEGQESEVSEVTEVSEVSAVLLGEDDSPSPSPTPANDRPPVPEKPHTRYCGRPLFWRGPVGPWRCGKCQAPKPGEAVVEWYTLPANGQRSGPAGLEDVRAEREARMAALRAAGPPLTQCCRCHEPLQPGQFQELLEQDQLRAECWACLKRLTE